MISFRPLREKLKRDGISAYWLVGQGVNSRTMHKIRHDLPVTTKTLNELCTILRCSISDIIEFIPDEEELG